MHVIIVACTHPVLLHIHVYTALVSITTVTPTSCLVQILPAEYNSGSSCLQQLVVQRNGAT